MKILIAEDSRVDRVLLERILSNAGYGVAATKTCEEALEAYRNGGIDIALLDWMLPSIGGLSLIREIRAQDLRSGRYCIIVMVTSKAQKDDLVRALESGADDFISKPIDEVLLVTKLKAIIRLSRGMMAAKEVV